MPSYEQIEQEIAECGIQIDLLPKTEVKALPDILQSNEHINYIVRGLYKGRNGVLVSTTDRIIFFDKGRLWGVRVEEFRYENITSVEYSTGLIAGEIIIYAAGNAAKIDMVPFGCKQFTDVVREIISNCRISSANVVDDDFLSKLERLAKLKRSGLLTDEEFILAKTKLLNS